MGFLSHFVLDAIPHGDQGIIQAATPKGRSRQLFIIAMIDCFLLLLVALALIAERSLANPFSMALAAFGAMLPDALQGITEFSHGRLLARFQRFHHLFHINLYPRFARATVSLPIGLLLQTITWYIAQSLIGL